MNTLNTFFHRLMFSVWTGIAILLANAICSYLNITTHASDWPLLANAIGVSFSVRIIYDRLTWKRRENELSKEFDEIMKVVKPELDVLFAQLKKNFTEDDYRKFIIEGKLSLNGKRAVEAVCAYPRLTSPSLFCYFVGAAGEIEKIVCN